VVLCPINGFFDGPLPIKIVALSASGFVSHCEVAQTFQDIHNGSFMDDLVNGKRLHIIQGGWIHQFTIQKRIKSPLLTEVLANRGIPTVTRVFLIAENSSNPIPEILL